MKAIATMIVLLYCHAVALAGDTLKPKPPPRATPCDPYTKQNIGSRRSVPYSYLRESDVMWEKRVWREIDLREKQNQPLYYPLELHPCRVSLIQALSSHILKEEIIAFKDEQFMVPYSLSEVRSRLATTDTLEQQHMDEMAMSSPYRR